MNLDEERRRGNKAKAILEDEVYREAWGAYEARLLEELANADRSEDQAKQLRALLISARKARAHLERIMRDGQVAAHELELLEKRSRFKGIFRAA